jgi:hypothetical protein
MAKSRPAKRRAVDTGRMLRPKAVVLGDAALIPEHRLITPPPDQFTHEVRRAQPYYCEQTSGPPDGQFAAGARVVLMRYEGGAYCRVVDSRGLYVATTFAGLRRL